MVFGYGSLRRVSRKVPYSATFLRDISYQRLQKSGDIRILNVEPGSGSQAIVCTLHNTQLSNVVNGYTALSYAWERSEKRNEIYCNGHPWIVTGNLFLALHNLRKPTSVQTLWVDQICIDQGNTEERSGQVRIMSHIYKHAREVMIWLGEGTSQSDAGMQLAQEILLVAAIRPDFIERGLTIKNLEQVGLPSWDDERWNMLGSIFRRSWFERIWVVQEVVMALNATVVCGSYSMTWEQLEFTCRYVQFTADLRTFGSVRTRNAAPLERVQTISRIRRLQELGCYPGMLELLLEFRSCKASDDRDKVFALCGLTNAEILPDYSQSVPNVLIQTARHLAKKHQREWISGTPNGSRKIFSLLYSAGIVSQQYSLPSWVPDWSISQKVRQLWRSEGVGYDAGGDSMLKFDILPSDQIRLSGVLLDTIETMGKALGEVSGDDCIVLGAWFDESKHLAERLPKIYRTGESLSKAYKRTLMADRAGGNPHYRRANSNDIETHHRALRFLYQKRLNYHQGLSFIEPTIVHKALSEGWYKSIVNECRGRAFFISREGYIGLVPHGAKQGDMIAVLLGGVVPVVLRPKAQGFILVGECYVHGIMYGELLRGHMSSVIQDINIL